MFSVFSFNLEREIKTSMKEAFTVLHVRKKKQFRVRIVAVYYDASLPFFLLTRTCLK